MDKHIIFGVFAGVLAMLITSSIVINHALNQSHDCMVEFNYKNYSVVRVGKYVK